MADRQELEIVKILRRHIKDMKSLENVSKVDVANFKASGLATLANIEDQTLKKSVINLLKSLKVEVEEMRTKSEKLIEAVSSQVSQVARVKKPLSVVDFDTEETKRVKEGLFDIIELEDDDDNLLLTDEEGNIFQVDKKQIGKKVEIIQQ